MSCKSIWDKFLLFKDILIRNFYNDNQINEYKFDPKKESKEWYCNLLLNKIIINNLSEDQKIYLGGFPRQYIIRWDQKYHFLLNFEFFWILKIAKLITGVTFSSS